MQKQWVEKRDQMWKKLKNSCNWKPLWMRVVTCRMNEGRKRNRLNELEKLSEAANFKKIYSKTRGLL